MATSEIILNKQRNLLRQAELDFGRQVRGLTEVDEVFEGESEGDGFGEGEGNVLIGLVYVGVLTNGDRAATDIALARELDPFLRSLDDN